MSSFKPTRPAEPEPAIRARQIEREVMDVRRKNAHCVKRQSDGPYAAQRQAILTSI